MRAWVGVCVLVAVSACYRGASELPACSIRCEQGCPNGMSCSNGYCTSGNTCTSDTDAGPACGELGQACCGGDPMCSGNGMCVAGTCQPGCLTDFSFGRRHSCLVRHDGTVWCTGYNNDGELGNGGTTNASTATYSQVSDAAGPITDATAIGAGAYHTCAVRAGGHVSCWGYDGYGQLGDNTTNTTGLAVTALNSSLEPLANIVEVHAGNYHTCGRDTTGGVWCWGRNNRGQLGDATFNERHYAAPAVTVTAVTQLDVQRDSNCALEGSHLSCWGRNDNSNLGDGTTNDQPSPIKVLDATPVTQVALAGYGGCAALADTTMKCWGGGWQGRIGNGTEDYQAAPTAVLASANTPLTGVIGVAASGVVCAVTSDHRALCWGNNPHGQVGNGAGSLFPAPVTNGENVSRLVAGYAHVCSLDLDGQIRCWGRNTEGEMGNGTFENVGAPQNIASICR